MKVSDLQKILADLERLLTTSGVRSSSATELAAFTASLEKFGDRELKAFTDLLGRVAADGTVAPKPTTRRAATPAPTVDLAALTRRVKEVYEHAAQEWVTEDVVKELCAQLERKEVSKDAIIGIAAEIEHKLKASDTKSKMVAAIRNRIIDRIGATTRRQLIERPGSVSNVTEG